MTKTKLLLLISDHSSRYGDLLLECMDKYNKFRTQDLTLEELESFVKEKGLLNKEIKK